jgi:hypothetical protein
MPAIRVHYLTSFTLRRGSWVLFYTIEAVAVVAVLNRYPDDADAAVSRQ